MATIYRLASRAASLGFQPLERIDGAGIGALRSVIGSNAWGGPITLEADTTLQVQTGGDVLNLSGAVYD